MNKSDYKLIVKVPGYCNGTFFLDKIEGSYDNSLHLLIFYIMVSNGIYNELLTTKQLKEFKKSISKYPSALFKINEESDDYNEENKELIDALAYEACVYVGYRLVNRGYELSMDFFEQYPEENINKKYLKAIFSNIEFNSNSKKEKYLKIILTKLNEIIEDNIINQNADYYTHDEIFKIIDKKGEHINFYVNIPKKYYNDAEILIYAINKRCPIYSLPKEALDIKNVALRLLRSNRDNIKFISERLKINKEFLMEAIKIDTRYFKYISDDLLHDKDILELSREILKQKLFEDGTLIENAGDELRKDRELALIAVKQNGNAFMYISDYFADDWIFRA